MAQLLTVVMSLLATITMLGLRIAYTVEVQNWALWIATVLASWFCVFVVGYIVSAIQHNDINS